MNNIFVIIMEIDKIDVLMWSICFLYIVGYFKWISLFY